MDAAAGVDVAAVTPSGAGADVLAVTASPAIRPAAMIAPPVAAMLPRCRITRGAYRAFGVNAGKPDDYGVN